MALVSAIVSVLDVLLYTRDSFYSTICNPILYIIYKQAMHILISLTHTHTLSLCAEPPFLMYANRDDETQGVTMTSLDGTVSETIITNMTASGLDYDFELVTLLVLVCMSLLLQPRLAIHLMHACMLFDFEIFLCRDNMIFWSDIDSESICMSALDGSNVKVIVNDTSDPGTYIYTYCI